MDMPSHIAIASPARPPNNLTNELNAMSIAGRAGADFRDIKRQGGWRNDSTVQGYIEEAGQFEENAAGSLLRKAK
jgi:hypothetical protein